MTKGCQKPIKTLKQKLTITLILALFKPQKNYCVTRRDLLVVALSKISQRRKISTNNGSRFSQVVILVRESKSTNCNMASEI